MNSVMTGTTESSVLSSTTAARRAGPFRDGGARESRACARRSAATAEWWARSGVTRRHWRHRGVASAAVRLRGGRVKARAARHPAATVSSWETRPAMTAVGAASMAAIAGVESSLVGSARAVRRRRRACAIGAGGSRSPATPTMRWRAETLMRLGRGTRSCSMEVSRRSGRRRALSDTIRSVVTGA